MKKMFLLFGLFSLSLITNSQTTYSWRSEATNGLWNNSVNWWNGSGQAVPGGSEILYFDNNVYTTMTNDLTGNSANRYQIIFAAGASDSRTISGTTENTFYNFSGNKPKIENYSAVNHTIGFPIKNGNSAGIEINPVNGNLTFSSTLDNNSYWVDIYGNNGKSLTISGGLSGSGGLTIKENSTVIFTGASTYTGDTYLDGGILQLNKSGGGSIPSTNNIIAGAGTLKVSTNQTIGNLNLGSNGSLTVDGGATLTITGSLTKTTGTGSITNNGTILLNSVSTTPQSQCVGGTFNPISVNASGTGLSFQWYSNTTQSNSGGTTLGTGNGAQTATYTPQATTSGTKYYYCVVTSGSLFPVSNVSGLFTVNQIPTEVSAVASPNPICAGATLTLTGTATGATSWSWTGPNNFAPTEQNPQITNITTAAAGIYSLIASNVCGSAVAVSTSSVTVNSLPAAAGPIAGNTTVSALTNGVSYSIDPISGATSYVWTYTDAFNVTINGAGTSVTLNFGLYATSGVLKVKGQNDCGFGTESTLSITVTPTITAWVGTVNSDWNNPGNWVPGVPVATTAVIINYLPNPFPYPIITGPVSCASIVIESGASILGNEFLTVNGTSKVKRVIAKNKWHFISPPVEGMTANSFLDFFLQTWSEPDAEWTYITDENTPLVAATGYSLFRDGSDNTYTFTGTLNTGMKQIGITESGTSVEYDGANLVGNPYPSYLDWDGLRSSYGAIYYWNGSDYDEWNGGGSGTQFAAPCQGFFIIKDENVPATQFTVTNDDRTNSIGTWYKSAEELRPNTLVLETSGNNYTDKLFVEFNNQAAETFELVNDAYKLVSTTEGISQLYSYTGEKKLSIDVRPSCEVIQLGFTNTLSGQYQIGISEMNSISKATLEDTKTATFHNLLNGPYSFSYTAGDDDKRFKIRMGTVGIDNPTSESFNIYGYDKTAVIDLPAQTKGNIYIYNLAGQLVAAEESATGKVSISLGSTGVYMVKVVTNMETLTKKVWIR